MSLLLFFLLVVVLSKALRATGAALVSFTRLLFWLFAAGLALTVLASLAQ